MKHSRKSMTSRLNLEIALSVRKNMENLCDKLGLSSITETIRVAIRILDILVTRVEEGQTIAVRYPNGTYKDLSIPEIETPFNVTELENES